jgi:hypothetical protein
MLLYTGHDIGMIYYEYEGIEGTTLGIVKILLMKA